ncbi:beta-galactosidase family protein [uncultured Rikenella sp.]|uniref:glycoside hydrolase family 35 protein n=1 Tax=uncultured Rikenella sp. TaxID=368003 RepID=UPI0025EE6F8E|nr:beta-galactosidase family protein [uncultured Rikenella sp.]
MSIKRTLAPLVFLLPLLLSAWQSWGGKASTFEAGKGFFMLDGKPFVIKAAELHYPRIPRDYWENRIQLCQALGMNTICLYVFWNAHEEEPGKFDFTGNNDLRHFIELCAKNGMKVILRPGPYVCAEWDMGGLPWWLLKDRGLKLRDDNPAFMERVALFERQVAEQVGDLTVDKGGPILMVQVENEYGAYGVNKKYVGEIRDMLRELYGPSVVLFQCDWSSNFLLNGLDETVWTLNFGTGANIDAQFRALKEQRPDAPLMCSEFWSGWFDRWGANHETRDASVMISGIEEMLSKGISFSLYMTHGGTNWGHWAGANSPAYAPDVTSYDYDAPISESGQTTPKYHALRRALAGFSDKRPSPIPPVIKAGKVKPFEFTEYAPLWSNLPEPVHSDTIAPMEMFDQGYGSIVYRTILPSIDESSVLDIDEVHDYARVFLDGKWIADLYRRNFDRSVTLPPIPAGARLDILVEGMGRVNFGGAMKDYKGITDRVSLTIDRDGRKFTCGRREWDVYSVHDRYSTYSAMNFEPLSDHAARTPGAYRATFTVKGRPKDTFLDFSTWGKGLVYVNGHAIGRIWEIGPQQTLYVPGCWLNSGDNEVIVFDILGPTKAVSEGLDHPVVDCLRLPSPEIHSDSTALGRFDGASPVAERTLTKVNGWQTIRFDSIAQGRYLMLETDGDDVTSIAEIHLAGFDGRRLPRESWKVLYADSEDTASGNHAADKIFDLQESTYWSTEKGTPAPHRVVIDLGGVASTSALQLLPRMESGAPGLPSAIKVFVR